ncbi:GumC family protein [Devosia sp.]|uniref:GumC family protein n=1 Tax=Devosia sp. TaxID=1871048 RepID=UPI002EF0015E
MTDESTHVADLRIDMGMLLRALRSRWLRIAVVTAGILIATAAVLLFVPKTYESTAGLLVEERANVLEAGGGGGSTIPVAAMMASQIELIKSRDTLLSVIDMENLRSEPEFIGAGVSPTRLVGQLLGRKPAQVGLEETVLQNLNDRLTVVQERDSAVISVIVRTGQPELSARIANAIAEAHVRRRAGLSLSDTAAASGWLKQEVDRLRIKVQQAEAAVASYRIDNDLFPGTDSSNILNQQLSSLSGQITAAQERRSAAQARAGLIRGLLEAGQPLDGVSDVRGSAIVQELIQTRATLQGDLAQRSTTLLPAHPTIRALKAQIAEVDRQIASEARRVADTLEAEAEIEGNMEAALRDDLARLKVSVSTAARDNVTLAGLEREAKAQRDLLESYLARYNEALSRTESSSALPDVRVVTLAAPAVQPASPKTAMILGAVGFTALALQIGGVLFSELLSGRGLGERIRIEVAEPPTLQVPALEQVAATPRPGSEIGLLGAEEEAGFVEAARASRAPEEPVMRAAAEIAAALPDDAMAPATAGLGSLLDEVAAGQARVVMLAALDAGTEALEISDALVAGCLRLGLSVCRVDAGSGCAAEEPGLTDLSAGRASFGDVVHRVGEGLAEVCWGTLPAPERRSMKPATLVAALTDVYDVAIVNTGRIGLASTLPLFAGIDCRLVLVGDESADNARLAAATDDAAALGYDVSHVLSAVARRRAEVA